jgi:hypothetical protein
VDGQAVALVSTTGTATPPLSVTASHVLNGSGKDLLRFRVTNASSHALTLAGLDWASGTSSGTLLAGCTIGANATQKLDVPLTLAGPSTWSAGLRRDLA